MRFWITKNSEIPIHEQLVRQVVLAIASEDLGAGQKLPSVRALARRHHIHANTVSAAYHDLLEQGWLELRRGSGLFVRSHQVASDGSDELDRMLAVVIETAKTHGHSPEEILLRLERLIRPRLYERILIVEPEPAMREILEAEITEHLALSVEAVAQADFSNFSDSERTLVVALPTRLARVRQSLPAGVLCVRLQLRSVRALLEGQKKPGANMVISIVSRSPEIRNGARTMLMTVGLAPESLCELDATDSGWQSRLSLRGLVITDVITARDLPSDCPAHVFRVIADSSIATLRQVCSV